MRRLSVLAVIVTVAACTTSDTPLSLSWRIEFVDDAVRDDAVVVEARILSGGCTGLTEEYRQSIDRAAMTSPLTPPVLGPGTYGFAATASNGTCQRIAAGCRDVVFADGEAAPSEVVVELAGTGVTSICEAADQCVAGACCTPSETVEISCSDETDGDCDGLVDCADPDCAGSVECPCDGIVWDGVRAGGEFTCANRAGATYCWGRNEEGQLGLGMASAVDQMAPGTEVVVTPAFLNDSLSVGIRHACAISDDRMGVVCWGESVRGQAGTLANELDGMLLSFGAEVGQVSAGQLHSCALLMNGTALCWGNDASGELGRGGAISDTFEQVPADVGGVTFDWISAGAGLSCGADTSGEVYCWGDNGFGQLGMSGMDRSTPGLVAGVSEAAAVHASQTHVCARSMSGVLSCWGSNGQTQLGVTGGGTMPPVPVGIPGGAPTSWDAMEAGTNFNCALGAGQVWCWGKNDERQAADSANDPTPVPTQIDLPADAVELSAGGRQACAVLSDGSLFCWGGNARGQLGQGDAAPYDGPRRVCP